MEIQERARAVVKRLREKESTYNRELLDEAADTIEALLEEMPLLVCCDSCKYRRVDVNDEPCYSCHKESNWEAVER